MSHMKTGTSGSVSSMISADCEVDERHPADHQQRDDRREHDLRQVAGEVASSASTPCTAAAAISALSRSVGAVGCARSAALHERQPQLREHARRGAAAGDLHAPRERAAQREACATSRLNSSRARTAAHRRTPARRSREQRRLQQHRPRRWRRRARRRRPAAGAPTACGGAGAGRARASGYGAGRADLLPAQSFAEHVVGPALVEQHDRREDRRDDRDHLERVVPGRGVGDRQAVRERRVRDEHARIQAR